MPLGLPERVHASHDWCGSPQVLRDVLVGRQTQPGRIDLRLTLRLRVLAAAKLLERSPSAANGILRVREPLGRRTTSAAVKLGRPNPTLGLLDLAPLLDEPCLQLSRACCLFSWCSSCRFL